MTVRLAEEGRMKGWHQGRTLPACRDVATAEVGNHRNASGFGKPRRVRELRGVAEIGTMANRLAVETNRRNGGRLEARRAQHREDRFGTAVH